MPENENDVFEEIAATLPELTLSADAALQELEARLPIMEQEAAEALSELDKLLPAMEQQTAAILDSLAKGHEQEAMMVWLELELMADDLPPVTCYYPETVGDDF